MTDSHRPSLPIERRIFSSCTHTGSLSVTCIKGGWQGHIQEMGRINGNLKACIIVLKGRGACVLLQWHCLAGIVAGHSSQWSQAAGLHKSYATIDKSCTRS